MAPLPIFTIPYRTWYGNDPPSRLMIMRMLLGLPFPRLLAHETWVKELEKTVSLFPSDKVWELPTLEKEKKKATDLRRTRASSLAMEELIGGV